MNLDGMKEFPSPSNSVYKLVPQTNALHSLVIGGGFLKPSFFPFKNQLLVDFWVAAILTGVKWYLIVVLICIYIPHDFKNKAVR